MKNISGFVLLIVLFLAFRKHDTGTIKGRVVPYNAALNVWAVSEKDTVRTTIQSAGEFELKANPGLYRVIVEGLRPYKTTTKTGVLVNSGSYVDIGDITLDQGNVISCGN
jgi:hypothetical protein